MVNIIKGRAPSCVADLIATPGATWAGVHGDQRGQMRACAIVEQGWVCAYCTRRIADAPGPAGKPSSTIEHWAARSAGGSHFDWPDLLAVCSGDLQGIPHCDRSRKSLPLNLHPAAPQCDVEELVATRGDGTVHCISHPDDLVALNLNHPTLVRSRREVIDAVTRKLSGASLGELREAEAIWRETKDGRRREYAAAALSVIRKTLARRTAIGSEHRRTHG